MTDRWQKFTEVALSPQILDELAEYCDEFLIHGVDVEGKGAGMDDGLVRMLGEWDGIGYICRWHWITGRSGTV